MSGTNSVKRHSFPNSSPPPSIKQAESDPQNCYADDHSNQTVGNTVWRQEVDAAGQYGDGSEMSIPYAF